MVVNTILAADAFDPFPFILLNLVLSCVAAIQAPLIMMSQNRQEEKDRRRAENDYKVNLKTEIMIEDLYDKVNAILAKQSALEKNCRSRKKQNRDQPKHEVPGKPSSDGLPGLFLRRIYLYFCGVERNTQVGDKQKRCVTAC